MPAKGISHSVLQSRRKPEWSQNPHLRLAFFFLFFFNSLRDFTQGIKDQMFWSFTLIPLGEYSSKARKGVEVEIQINQNIQTHLHLYEHYIERDRRRYIHLYQMWKYLKRLQKTPPPTLMFRTIWRVMVSSLSTFFIKLFQWASANSRRVLCIVLGAWAPFTCRSLNQTAAVWQSEMTHV